MQNHNVQVSPELRCTNRYKPFKDSHCLLSISVGKDAHESKKFQATLELIKKFRFCTICVGDSLQRFTLAIMQDRNPNELLSIATQAGTDWISRNLTLIKNSEIDYKIKRWDSYLEQADFEIFKQEILNDYQANSACYEAFKAAIDTFLARQHSHITVSLPVARDFCFEYLLEESTVLRLWAMEGYDYEAYPGRRNEAMEYVYQKFVVPKYANTLTSVLIKSVNFVY